MSIRFSRVCTLVNSKAAIFLVGGIPTSQNDLNPWTAFQNFAADLHENEAITAKVESFEYGDEEAYDASPEEVAYFYTRIEMQPDFIEDRTRKIGDSAFIFWLSK